MRDRPILCPLAQGEFNLLMRGVRDFIRSESLAISEAKAKYNQSRKEKDRLHAEDVRQHALLRIKAAQELLAHLHDVAKGKELVQQ